jgi:Mg/Co/Ni transporter MgtE
VVDGANRLVGAVTVDDVLDHSLPRDWRDRDSPVTVAQAAESLAADNLFHRAEAARATAAEGSTGREAG